ncbi:MAG: DUF2059 domain-containing protein [Candidatus Omnitrophota bacterium]|nr:DUF2059 domain-containing protein [Candidatus Omnitrophota bacterium]MDZ4241965.1 DUF2059 domain-containing protein [Candidatus Omnitrophota bacterium]
MNTRIAVITAGILLAGACAASADTVYLKNGTKIDGQITKDTGYSVQIKVGDTYKSYYINEIERVERDKDKVEAGDPAMLALQTGKAEELTDQKKQLVLRFLEANGVRESIGRMFQQLLADVPPESRESYRRVFKSEEVIDRLVPLYAKYYTSAELKELIVFYRGPVGQKILSATPYLVNDTMTEMTKYFQEKSQSASELPVPQKKSAK